MSAKGKGAALFRGERGKFADVRAGNKGGEQKPPLEPHQPELCNFTPTTFVDISAVMDAKLEAMAAMESQVYLQTYYAQRAEQRGNHARRASGNSAILQAEAFQRVLPQVVDEL